MRWSLATLMLVLTFSGCGIPEGTFVLDQDTLPDEMGFRQATHVARATVCGKEYIGMESLVPMTDSARKRVARNARRLKYSSKAESDYLGLPSGQVCYRYYKDGKPCGPWLCIYRAWHGPRCVIYDLRAFEWDRKSRKARFTYYGPKNVRFSFGYEEAAAVRIGPR